jgi:hypothetical protein
MTKHRRSAANPTGGEPLWNAKEEPQRIDIVKAFNWYNVEKDEKDAAKILKCPVSVARQFTSLAWAKRMQERGFKLPANEAATYIDRMLKFKEATKKPAVEDTAEDKNVISIQERIKAKSEEIIGEMEGLIDDYGIRGNASDMNAYQWMVDNEVKPIHANRIIEYFREGSKEIFLAASGKDKELKEGYEAYTKARLMNLLQCYAAIIKDAEKLAANTKLARKPRKRKAVSAEKKVSKIKYLVRDDKLKLQSVDPVRVINAQQLWIFNVKTRKLGVYVASDRGGLQMKGTTLKNYNEDESISKTVRKPDKVLPTVTEGGKVALRKLMDSINSKSNKLNGRINKDTLLLRVV